MAGFCHWLSGYGPITQWSRESLSFEKEEERREGHGREGESNSHKSLQVVIMVRQDMINTREVYVWGD